MDKIKKCLGLLVCIAITMIGVPSLAYSQISVTVNGSQVQFDQPPIAENGRTLVPVRAIFEAMGCEVEWNDGVVSVYRNGQKVMELTIGSDIMYLWDRGEQLIYKLDVPAKTEGGRTLVPARAVGEGLGADVSWDGYTGTVKIYYDPDYYSNYGDYDYYDYYDNDYDDYDYDCRHTSTRQVCSIDLRSWKQTGSSATHQTVDVMEEVCNDCGETIRTYNERRTEAHVFVNGVCRDCGYEKEEKVTVKHPSSGSLDIKDDGNFKLLTLQSGESFTVTNDTEKTFTIQILNDGVKKRYHYVKYNKDGDVTATGYYSNTYSTISLPAKAVLALYNSEDSEIQIKAPSDVFFPVDEEAFEIKQIKPGASCRVENTGKKNIKICVLSKTTGTIKSKEKAKYDYVSYDADGNVKATKFKTTTQALSVYSKGSISISNSSDETIYVFCPARAAEIN